MLNCLDEMHYICDREVACNGICTEASHSLVTYALRVGNMLCIVMRKKLVWDVY